MHMSVGALFSLVFQQSQAKRARRSMVSGSNGNIFVSGRAQLGGAQVISGCVVNNNSNVLPRSAASNHYYQHGGPGYHPHWPVPKLFNNSPPLGRAFGHQIPLSPHHWSPPTGPSFLDPLHGHETEKVSVIVDHSNLLGGLRGRPADYRRLLLLLSRGRVLTKAVAIGSHPYPLPSSSVRTWEDEARAVGWSTIAFDRVNSREQGVDETIHAQVSDIALDEGPRRLILLTGDGNKNGGFPNTNFLDLTNKLLRKGIQVELWSWRDSCHGDYMRMAELGVWGFSLKYLDMHGI